MSASARHGFSFKMNSPNTCSSFRNSLEQSLFPTLFMASHLYSQAANLNCPYVHANIFEMFPFVVCKTCLTYQTIIALRSIISKIINKQSFSVNVCPFRSLSFSHFLAFARAPVSHCLSAPFTEPKITKQIIHEL